MNIRTSHDGPARGADNMAQDLALLDSVRTGVLDVAVRTYTWEPWCVSLGHHQREDAIDRDLCELRGYDVVRRPTGGRAVLHADELTYAVAVRTSTDRTAQQIYAMVHEAIHAALLPLVPHLAFTGVGTDLRTHYASSGALGQICFTAHARTEITVDGRKVVGSAQRVLDGIVLQHGSILCGDGHEQIADLVSASESTRSSMRSTIERSSATLSSAAGRPLSPDLVADCLRDLGEQISTLFHRSLSDRTTID